MTNLLKKHDKVTKENMVKPWNVTSLLPCRGIMHLYMKSLKQKTENICNLRGVTAWNIGRCSWTNEKKVKDVHSKEDEDSQFL